MRSARPVTLRAEYGPFMTRQTVPTQYFIPDLSDRVSYTSNRGVSMNDRVVAKQGNTPSVITDFKPHQMDLSAHLVTKEVKTPNTRIIILQDIYIYIKVVCY